MTIILCFAHMNAGQSTLMTSGSDFQLTAPLLLNGVCQIPEDEGVGAAKAQNQSLSQLQALRPHEWDQLLEEPSHGRATWGHLRHENNCVLSQL